MHNLPVLVKGKPRCTLHVHPDDAERYELLDGADAEVRSRTGAVVAQVEVTDAIMPGVVSLPHGWGHDVAGTQQRVAADHPGTNSNVLADELLLDAAVRQRGAQRDPGRARAGPRGRRRRNAERPLQPGAGAVSTYAPTRTPRTLRTRRRPAARATRSRRPPWPTGATWR